MARLDMEYVTKTALHQEVNRLDRRIEVAVGALEDRMIGRLAEMESRFMRYVDRRIDEAVTAIQATLLGHDRRFDAHDKRFDAIDQRFDVIEKRLDAHDKRFDAIEKRLDAHDRRFDAIDATLAEHGQRLSTLEENVQNIIQTQGDILVAIKGLSDRLAA